MREFKRKQAEHPFSDYWLYVVFHSGEGRRMANLVLKSDTKVRTTLSYARYLMSVHLGRVLEDCEQVDHINGDKLDDRIENFQLLSEEDNVRKGVVDHVKSSVMIQLVCPICDSVFYRPKNKAYKKIHLGLDMCCSKECGRIKTSVSLTGKSARL